MAVLRIEGGDLALHLSAAEKIGAVHGDLRVRLAAVSRVEVLEDAHEPADHGIKLGTRIPGRTEVGTVRGDGRNIFAAVLPDTPRGLRIVLDGSFYHEWIVGCADPESVARQITADPVPPASVRGPPSGPGLLPAAWPPPRRARHYTIQVPFPTMLPCAWMTARPAWPPRYGTTWSRPSRSTWSRWTR